jgi:hypothetical protein
MSFIQMVRDNMHGGTLDTMHALYFRGPLESGDLPSKGGFADLVLKGWAETIWDEAKPHRLNALGRATAKTYYESMAASAAALTNRSEFTVAELKAKLAEGAVRWMASDGPSVRDTFPDDAVFTLDGVLELNPAGERRSYLITHPVSGLRGYLIFTIGDRGTDCDSKLLNEE